MAATLAKQSGASRTSPILRGNWVAEALLGDKLPRPPKNVPQLPDDESRDPGARQCASSSSGTPPTLAAPVAIRASMRSVSLWRATTPSAAGAIATLATGQSTPPPGCATAPSLMAWMACGATSGRRAATPWSGNSAANFSATHWDAESSFPTILCSKRWSRAQKE